MPEGTYTLIVELAESATIAFGAAGERDLPAGWYAYTGTAFGPGGFARVERHRELARGERDVRHWHVDYLLGHPDARIVDAVTSPDADAECEVSRGVATHAECDPVTGLGASDCGCDSHLLYAATRDSLERAVRTIHDDLGSDR